MAAKVVAHPETRYVEIIEAPVGGFTELNVVADIYSALKDDWFTDTTLQPLRFPFTSFGPLIGTEQIGPYVFFDNTAGWRMQPYDDDHEINLKGNLIPKSAVDGLSIPLWLKRPGRTIIIPTDRSAQALSVASSGGGLTTTQAVQLLEIYKRLSLDATDKFKTTPTEMRTESGDIVIKLTGDGVTFADGERQ